MNFFVKKNFLLGKYMKNRYPIRESSPRITTYRKETQTHAKRGIVTRMLLFLSFSLVHARVH